MKLLVTGAGGMLGQTLSPCLKKRGHDVTACGKQELDVTDLMQVSNVVQQIKPNLILHCAAYTAVDLAETEQAKAHLVNGQGTENVAIAASKHGIPVLFVSTDYVFDGKSNKPYKPEDQTGPISVYGHSKLAGELAIKKHCSQYYIVRTSWLYGPYGKNFVDTIYKLAEERDQIQVVADQVGSPTSTLTLSAMIADLIVTGKFGVYHTTDEGTTSWFDFAREIVKPLQAKGKRVEVLPIETRDMPRPAPRPSYSVLDKQSLIEAIERPLTPWRDALREYLELKEIKAPA